MDAVIIIGLPLALAFIMFSLGLGLTVRDFLDLARTPRAFAVGFGAQVLVVPLVAFGLLQVFDLEAALAFGVMILAFCPGGATTNLLSRFARGDVALSVTLTAVVSVLSVVTMPLLVGLSAGYFLGDDARDIDIAGLALQLFLITTVPTAAGMLVRRARPDFAARAEPVSVRIAGILFVVVVVGALLSQLDAFFDNIATLGPLLVVLNVILLGIAYGLARLARLSERRAATVAIEAGVQNATLGITVATLLDASEVLPTFAVPSAVYGITMYAVTLPAIFLFLRQPAEEDVAVPGAVG